MEFRTLGLPTPAFTLPAGGSRTWKNLAPGTYVVVQAPPIGAATQVGENEWVIEGGLQTDVGYPHKGKLDYIAPTINQGTGTLAARASLPNEARLLLPGFFVRVRVPLEETPALLVPAVALGSDQGGRYVLIVNGENVVEQRKVEVGPAVGEMAVIETGLKPEDRVVTAGILRAVPGQKVDPQAKTAELGGSK